MKILLDDTPLRSGHANRGIGTYTRQLLQQFNRLHLASIVTGSWKDHWKEVDLLHLPYFDFFSATLPHVRKPTIVTIHDVIPLQFPEQYLAGKRGTFNLWLQKRALRSVKAIITDSHASKIAIHDHLKVPLSRIHVIYLAADPDLKAPELSLQQKVKQKYSLPDDYVLYVGDINYNKNLPQLIKALKFVSASIHLVLVGRNFKVQNIPEWKAIERQIALSDVSNRVHFVTDVKTDDHEGLASIYAQSICYLQPSLAEGFGLPVLDALQIGTPVIASNRTSLPEVGGPSAHYVEPDAESFARAITEVYDCGSEKRAAIIKAGRLHAETFTWETTARKTAAVYQRVLSS